MSRGCSADSSITLLGRAIPTALLAGSLVISLGACSEGQVAAAEQNVTDSFYRPTEHGELVFGMPNQASFDDNHRFHAWTFTLSAEAHVDVATELKTMNLDSVMYMYRRDLGVSEWGSYVAKNDDHANSLASRITGDYTAGEYRILVKAAKIHLRGAFTVLGDCSGAGCPAPPGGECSVDAPATMPASTGFTASCAGKIQSVLLAPVLTELQTDVLYEERCDHGALVGNAVDHYRSYWEGLVDWEDMFWDGEQNLEISATFHGDAGAIVYVSAGGDEDTLRFVFGPDNQLLMHYHDEQSPVAEYYCGEAGEPTLDEPQLDCISRAMRYGPHRAEKVEHQAGVTSLDDDDAFADYYFFLPVLREFGQTYGIADSDPITYAADYWFQRSDQYGGTITFNANGTEATYFIGERDYGNWTYMFTRTVGDATEFICTDDGP